LTNPRLNDGMVTLVLMGVSGSGKSTLGRALAAALAAPFLEGDDFHPPANIAKMSSGIALQDEDRWPWLDSLGAAVRSVLQEHTLAVVSCSALKRRYRDRLRSEIRTPLMFIWITAPVDLISSRMRHRHHYMPESLLISQIAALEPPDATECALCVEATQPIEQLVGFVTERVESLRASYRI
jgi:gluconokinase